MKVNKKRFKIIQIILRLVKVLCGSVGATFVITNYKWLGLSILAIGAIANESLTIIKEENENKNKSYINYNSSYIYKF
jgi:hypothetical protein